jgi:hypothetical protein
LIKTKRLALDSVHIYLTAVRYIYSKPKAFYVKIGNQLKQFIFLLTQLSTNDTIKENTDDEINFNSNDRPEYNGLTTPHA